MSSSGAASGSITAALADMQNGVVLPTDLAISAISISTVTGALSFTLAAAAQSLYVKSAAGVLTAIGFAGGAQTPAALTPATPNYAVVGVEITTAGTIALVKGTDTATQLNTGSLIASNTPATTAGRLRLFDFAIQNNAGAFRFGDQTTVASQGVNWIDRRPWARGGYARVLRNANAAAGNDYATASTTNVLVDSVNLAIRMECTGVPVRVALCGRAVSAADGSAPAFAAYMDGTGPDGASTTGQLSAATVGGAAGEAVLQLHWDFAGVAAGSHLFQPVYASPSASTTTIRAQAAIPLIFTVEERVSQSVTNGAA